MPVNADTQQRIAQALDVSGAMCNCFFHAYSAHLLSNGLALPADLFTPNPTSGDSPAEQLKQLFTSADDLELFANSYIKNHPGAAASNMLVEKTLVLGVLFREWFAKKLLSNTTRKEELMESIIQWLPIIGEGIKEGEFASVYESNKDFFDQQIQQIQQIQNFNAADFRAYWNNEGYQNYCKHLARSGVTISPSDVAPTLHELNIPYAFYDKANSRAELPSEANDSTMPPLEVALDTGEGHYFLLRNQNTSAALDAYQASFDQYKLDREAVLGQPGNVEARYIDCLSKSSPLLAAILPPDPNSPPPSELLIRQIVHIKATMQHEQTIEPDAAQSSTPRSEVSEVSDATTSPVEPTAAPTELPAEDVTQTETSLPLTEKEQQTFDATLAALAPEAKAHEKFNNYKEILNALIMASRHLKPRAEVAHIEDDQLEDIVDLDKAEAKEDETDETFAERLQAAEFKRSGLK